MKKRNILSAAKAGALACAAGLILTATVGSAWSYFTTYTSAAGGYAVSLDNETRIEEDFSDSTKRLVVTNDGTQPVYVRARAYSARELEYTDAEGAWTPGGDGYYYYNRALDGRQETGEGTVTDATSELRIRIAFPDKEGLEDGDGFNVVVIYESAPVQYDANENVLSPQEVDWSAKLDSNGEGGNS